MNGKHGVKQQTKICGEHTELCRKLMQTVRKKLIQFSLSLVEKNKEKENREAVCKTDRMRVESGNRNSNRERNRPFLSRH